jgi:hypothetical protein
LKHIITIVLKEYSENLITEKKRVQFHPRTISDLEYLTDVVVSKWKERDDEEPLVGRIYMEDGAGDKGFVPLYYLSTYGNEAAVQVKDNSKPLELGNIFLVVNPDEMLNPNAKSIYNTLFHELQHVFDTNTTRYRSDKNYANYSPDSIEDYYGHPYEQRAYYNEALEGIVRGYKELFGYYPKEEIENSLETMLGFFGQGKRGDNILKKVLYGINSEDDSEDMPHVLRLLSLVKQGSPDSWKNFLNMLYSTVEEIKSEMDQYYSEEELVEKEYKKPRKMSKSYCEKTPCKDMGFSQKASCRPYKNCYSK